MFSGFFLEIFIAWRYLRSQAKVPIFNVGTRVSLIFMAIMVFVMVIVLSVFIGFQETVHKTLQNSGNHLTVMRRDGKPFYGYKKVFSRSQQNHDFSKYILHAFPSISLNVLLENYGQFEGKGLRAVPFLNAKKIKNDPKALDTLSLDTLSIEERAKYFPPLVYYNEKYLKKFNRGRYVILGREMARYYGLRLGERIHLLLPKGGFLSTDIKIKQESFIIAGLYRTGFYEFDSNLIFMSLQTAQSVLKIPRQATEMIFQLENLDNIEQTKKILHEDILHPRFSYFIRTIYEERGNFLAALQLEKTLMMVILSLLIVAGAAGIWVTVRLLIKAREKSIGMLRTMGMSRRSLIFIFTAHSMFIGFLSAAIGGSLGIYTANRMETLIILIEDTINGLCNAVWYQCAEIELVPKNIYYFDHIPIQAEMGVILGIALSTLILSGLAGYFPARIAAHLDPVVCIRSE